MIPREAALKILNQKLKNKNLVRHCFAVEASMGTLARKLGVAADREIWERVGLMHDADWEATQSDPSMHTRKTVEWLKEAGETDQKIIDAILSHNFDHNGFRKPESKMDWALYTCDELTGLIVAVALVQPDKKLLSVKVKSVLKKFPVKSFAAGVHRDQIELCEEKLGIPLEEFVTIVLSAMQEIHEDLGL